MKNTAMMKNAPKMVAKDCFQVTKAFSKNAMIFGTPEYKVWREILHDYPNAKMVCKKIKKKANKNTSTKNMTYEHMALYIRQQKNATTLMVEFKKRIEMSKVQTNPYRCVLAWFKQTFEDYDNYKAFFAAEAQKEAEKHDIFTLVKSSAVIDGEDSAEEEFDLVSGL